MTEGGTGRSADLTLAFTLEALRRLADPRAAVEDARGWTEYVGAVSAEPNGALAFTRDRRIRLDFFSGTRTPAETLFGVRATYDTERHVLVGVEGQREVAEECGWSFRPVQEAAERAGWELRDGSRKAAGDAAGPVGRLVARVRSALGG